MLIIFSTVLSVQRTSSKANAVRVRLFDGDLVLIISKTEGKLVEIFYHAL